METLYIFLTATGVFLCALISLKIPIASIGGFILSLVIIPDIIATNDNVFRGVLIAVFLLNAIFGIIGYKTR